MKMIDDHRQHFAQREKLEPDQAKRKEEKYRRDNKEELDKWNVYIASCSRILHS
jgi:hypothetical protein